MTEQKSISQYQYFLKELGKTLNSICFKYWGLSQESHLWHTHTPLHSTGFSTAEQPQFMLFTPLFIKYRLSIYYMLGNALDSGDLGMNNIKFLTYRKSSCWKMTWAISILLWSHYYIYEMMPPKELETGKINVIKSMCEKFVQLNLKSLQKIIPEYKG